MPLVDIVIDTNVFLHAENPQEPRQRDADALLNKIRACVVQLCVDDGFDIVEAQNRSVIGAEYLKWLRAGSLGYALVTFLAGSARLKILPRAVPAKVSKAIRTQVPNGPDRTFLKIAFNSQEKVLSSHDFNDIPQTVRNRLFAQVGLSVVDADRAKALL
jgi:hypothetical protein